MKTPSFLLLAVFFAALPAAAAPDAGARCDTKFLEKVAHDFSKGGTVPDARIVDQVVDGLNHPVLKLDDASTCDAGTWKHVAYSWANPDVKKYWNGANAGHQAEIVLIADDFYRAIDPKIAGVLAAADEVIAAGAALGIVVTSELPKAEADFLKANSGGALASAAPKTLGFPVPIGGGTVTRESVGPTLRLVLGERGTGPGTAVTRFRLAVLALGEEIAVRGKTSAAVVSRAGEALPKVKDFMPGLPSSITTQAFNKANAADPKFKAALEALVGKGVLKLDEPNPKESFLFSLDLGLNNLIAIRSSQIDTIMKQAVPKLKGMPTITALEVEARAHTAALDAKNPLAAAVMERLAQTPEYARLDALYDNMVKQKGEAAAKADPLGVELLRARDQMKAAALSAAVEPGATGRKAVVFTQDGHKTTLGSLVPSLVEKDEPSRQDAASIIARFIADGSKDDARYQAIVAALSGAGQPGMDMGEMHHALETGVIRKVPDPVKKVNAGGSGMQSLADIGRNNYESYAARQQAAAADKAADNARARSVVDVRNAEEVERSNEACAAKKTEASATKKDDFLSRESNAARKAAAVAAAEQWCAADLARVAAKTGDAKAALAAKAAGADDPGKIIASADADLAAAFGAAIKESVGSLRSEYTSAEAGPRLTKLIREAKLSGPSGRLTGFIELWFNGKWPQDEARKSVLKAAVDKCAADLGYRRVENQDSDVSYSNPENLDAVDKKCGIHAELKAFVAGKKGTVNEE